MLLLSITLPHLVSQKHFKQLPSSQSYSEIQKPNQGGTECAPRQEGTAWLLNISHEAPALRCNEGFLPANLNVTFQILWPWLVQSPDSIGGLLCCLGGWSKLLAPHFVYLKYNMLRLRRSDQSGGWENFLKGGTTIPASAVLNPTTETVSFRAW